LVHFQVKYLNKKGVLLGKPTNFAVFYSIGNVLSLSGTLFLVGPKIQFKNMTNKTRFISLIYI